MGSAQIKPMTQMLSLIDADRSHRFAQIVTEFGNQYGLEPHWLCPGHAVEFGPSDTFSANSIKTLIAGIPGLDWALTPAHDRRKRLILCDMDSTIIQNECIDEIAAYHGIGPKVADITERAMRGELDFAQALRERVALLAGLNVADISTILADRIQLTAGAKTLIATMRAHGAGAYLVSGGFTHFTGAICRQVGFNDHFSNQLEVEGGKLTGQVVPPILGAEAKLEKLQELTAQHDLPLAATMAVGDGANDIQMIEQSGLGCAFHGKPIVQAAADAAFNNNDLTALLYIQGYHETEFVQP